MVQYGFFFDESRCTDCRACAIVCRDWYNIPAGPVKWLRLFQYEKGSYPNVTVNTLWAPCYHCENPVCVDAANGAMYKEEKYGAVLIDPDKATSIDLRNAQEACPYGAIQFDSDAMNATASKCTMCIDRLEQGLTPRCAEQCIQRALDFGPLDDLVKKYGSSRQLEDMPSPDLTKPAIVFKAQRTKKQIVPYDANAALQLMAKRDAVTPGLAPVFNSPSDVTDIPAGIVGRDRLNMKPKNSTEALYWTKNDEA
jgi:anaerobic dimethyl sulfoxide reductase subunit B (iron-sulfur subunit)